MPNPLPVEWLFLISVPAGFIGAMSGMAGRVILIPALSFFHLDIESRRSA